MYYIKEKTRIDLRESVYDFPQQNVITKDNVSIRINALLYFQIIDPLSLNKQGEDVGTRYRTGVYYEDAKDAEVLREVFQSQQKCLGVDKLAVELGPLKSFYPAEEYHQDYLDKHPGGYCHLTPAHFALARQSKK